MPDEAPINPIPEEPKVVEPIPAVTPVSTITETSPQSEPIVDIQEREKEIKRKKKKFIRLVIIGLIACLILALIPVGINFYKTYFLKSKPVVQDVPDENKGPVIPEVIDVSKMIQYNSDLLKISLEYSQAATLSEIPDNINKIQKIEIAYDKQDGQEKITETNLKEGYLFRASTFVTTQRDLDGIVEVKKAAMVSKCPKTSLFSNPSEVTINGFAGVSFEVTNCGADYKLTYVVKSGLNYEFAQIYKGDVGYRQVYRAATDDILTSVRFYPDESTKGPLETFTASDGFSFKYPKTYKSDCCDMPTPVSNDAAKIVTLGDPQTLVDRGNFDGFGIFFDHFDEGFDAYLNKIRKTMVDDYIVVKGQAPTLSETSIKVDGKDATLLKGYTWSGNDLIYLNLSSDTSGNVLIIEIKNISGDKFETTMNEVLKSFVFVEKR